MSNQVKYGHSSLSLMRGWHDGGKHKERIRGRNTPQRQTPSEGLLFSPPLIFPFLSTAYALGFEPSARILHPFKNIVRNLLATGLYSQNLVFS